MAECTCCDGRNDYLLDAAAACIVGLSHMSAVLSAADLAAFTKAAFERVGVPAIDAAIAAECLVDANLAGIDSHGVVHLAHYLRRLENGTIAAAPQIMFERPRPGIVTVDGRHGLGHVVVARAIEHGIELCREHGSVVIVVRNSSHFGMAAYHMRRIVSADLAGMILTHTDVRIVPIGARKPFAGTNPLALGLPSAGAPLILDFATSAVPFGKISVAKAEGRAIPADWGLNARGDPTTDPAQVVGLNPAAGHKGSGLAMIIDLLCALSSGMPFGPYITRMFDDMDAPRRLGHFVTLWDLDALFPIDEIKRRVADYVAELHALPRRDPQVPIYHPGEPEDVCRAKRVREGIPIDAGLRSQLLDIGRRLQLDVSVFQ